MSRIMNKIILSSGIEGIDWRHSINLLVGASSNISHFDNVMLNTKGKYDDLVFEKAEINPTHKNLKPQFKGYLTHLLKNEKNQVSVLSDPIFLDSGAAMQTLNSDKTFAFFFCSPEYYLAKMEDATGDGENIDQQECLDNWLEGACKMWEFYVCYPDSTLLINIEDVARDPRLSASKVFEFVGCELDDIDNNQAANSVDTAVANPIEKLSLLLLQNMKLETIKASSELNERYENLAVTSILADKALSYDPSERAGMRLSECQKLITVISTSQVQLEFDSATLAASNSELMGDNEKFKAEFATRSSALETSLSECKAENELALLQIHQMQEELETSYLNAKELKGEFATQTSGLETHLADLKAENELALLQINQLQEELEATYLNAEKVKGELAVGAKSLETQLTKFKAENELAAVKINQLEEELETAYSNAKELKGVSATRATALETQLTKFKAENELAAVQINQLEEELETAYSNAKELKGVSATRAKALETQLKKFKAENELAAVKINQLEEELETAYSNAKELNRKSATRTSALETSLSGHKAANELALLQIHQLQEELETAYSNAKELKGESATRTSALETSLSELTAENDQAFLQINHLQEELEHYYIQFQKMTYSPKREINYVTDLNKFKVSLSLMNMN
jgi:chromosome segregation ATPase